MSTRTPGRGGKSRIVIDVDKARQSAPKSRGAGRGLKIFGVTTLVIVGALVAVLVAGLLIWNSFKSGPVYSLALLVDAAQRDDAQEFERLIDSDRIAQSLVPQVAEKLTGSAEAGALAASATAAARPQLEAATPQLIPRVREGVREEMSRRIKSVYESGDGRAPFVLLALGLKRYSEVSEEADGAAATVALNSEGRKMELRMERTADERWKVVAVKSDEIAKAFAERLGANALPALAPQPTPTPPQKRSRARGRRTQ